jgi:FixJ family two-component response regulator
VLTLLQDTHVARDQVRREHEKQFPALRQRFGLLTSGEREVMAQHVQGHLTK